MKPDDTLQLREFLADPAMCGVHAVDARADADYLDAARALDFAAVAIDFAGCTGKDDAIARIAAALGFPAWFGRNWDALADCLGDLSWWPASGYVLLLDHAGGWRDADPDGFATLLGVLGDAAAAWSAQRIPFWALLPLSTRALEELA